MKKVKDIKNFKSRKEWEESMWLDILNVLESKNNFKEFLNAFLTENEKEMLRNRVLTTVLLKEGRTYREIGNILWISPGTISAIRKGLKNSNYKSNRSGNSKISKPKNIKEKGRMDYWLNFPFPKLTGRGRWDFLNYQG